MSSLLSKAFWASTGERATYTAAETLLAGFAVGGPVFSLDWAGSLSLAATATVVSILKSIIVNGATNGGGPGITETPTAALEGGKHEEKDGT